MAAGTSGSTKKRPISSRMTGHSLRHHPSLIFSSPSMLITSKLTVEATAHPSPSPATKVKILVKLLQQRKEVQANIARVKFEGASKNFNESVIATVDAVVHTNSTISSNNEHGWDDGIDDSPALHLNPEDSQQEQVVLMRVRRLAKKLDINEEDAIMFQRAQMRLAKQMQRICFDSWLSSPHAADERHSMNIGHGKELKNKKEISREEKETYNGEVGARSSRRDLLSDTTTTAALGDSAILSTTSLIELRDVLCDIDIKTFEVLRDLRDEAASSFSSTSASVLRDAVWEECAGDFIEMSDDANAKGGSLDKISRDVLEYALRIVHSKSTNNNSGDGTGQEEK